MKVYLYGKSRSLKQHSGSQWNVDFSLSSSKTSQLQLSLTAATFKEANLKAASLSTYESPTCTLLFVIITESTSQRLLIRHLDYTFTRSLWQQVRHLRTLECFIIATLSNGMLSTSTSLLYVIDLNLSAEIGPTPFNDRANYSLKDALLREPLLLLLLKAWSLWLRVIRLLNNLTEQSSDQPAE